MRVQVVQACDDLLPEGFRSRFGEGAVHVEDVVLIESALLGERGLEGAAGDVLEESGGRMIRYRSSLVIPALRK